MWEERERERVVYNANNLRVPSLEPGNKPSNVRIIIIAIIVSGIGHNLSRGDCHISQATQLLCVCLFICIVCRGNYTLNCHRQYFVY